MSSDPHKELIRAAPGSDPLKTLLQANNRAQERTDAHRAEIKLAAKSDVAAAKATNPSIQELRLDEAITDLVIEKTPEELNADLVQGGFKKKYSKTQSSKIIADAAERTDEEGNLPASAILALLGKEGISAEEQADLIGSIDTNGDGSVSLGEYLAFFFGKKFQHKAGVIAKMETAFAKYDKSGDGSIDVDEYEAMCQDLKIGKSFGKRMKMWTLMDLNHDKKLNLDEFKLFYEVYQSKALQALDQKISQEIATRRYQKTDAEYARIMAASDADAARQARDGRWGNQMGDEALAGMMTAEERAATPQQPGARPENRPSGGCCGLFSV